VERIAGRRRRAANRIAFSDQRNDRAVLGDGDAGFARLVGERLDDAPALRVAAVRVEETVDIRARAPGRETLG
jgi:hypothetical protein